MSAILSILGSGAFGSALGSLFQWLNRKAEIQAKAAEYKHAEAMIEIGNKQAIALADKAMQQTREQGEQTVAKLEADAFVESQKAPTVPIGEILKSWVRTAIVGYLLLLATFLAMKVGKLVGGLESLDTAVLMPLYADIVAQVFFLVNLAVSWYFGARGTSISKRTK